MKLTLQELQFLETEMLKEVSEICDQNNIDYYLAYGSLLGAVRHRGPIPWDNDLDIAVPDNQLLKFIKVVREQLSDKFYLDYHDVNKNYILLFPRIGLKGYSTKVLHIDVYRIIGAPEDLHERIALKKRANKLKNIIQYKNLKEGYFAFNKISKKEKVVVYVYSFLMVFVSKNRLIKKFENICRKYPFKNHENTVNIAGGYGIKEFLPKKIYGKGIIVEYAGLKVWAPELYEQYLYHFYDNYTEFPPEEHQKVIQQYFIAKYR